VEFIGEIGEQDKNEFLSNAYALLFPIDWPEPFGMVMIEAMACGTPVIAFRCGSVPEVIDEGQTGFICDTLEEAVRAVEHVQAFDPRTLPPSLRAALHSDAHGPRLPEYLQAGSRKASGPFIGGGLSAPGNESCAARSGSAYGQGGLNGA
jgi:glycosyltransferase involved in cell wall biosynthesis